MQAEREFLSVFSYASGSHMRDKSAHTNTHTYLGKRLALAQQVQQLGDDLHSNKHTFRTLCARAVKEQKEQTQVRTPRQRKSIQV